VEETGIPRENHWLAANHWQTLWGVHLAWAVFELTTLVVIGTDCTGSCKCKTTIRSRPPLQNRNIVESGIKHHNPNPLSLWWVVDSTVVTHFKEHRHSVLFLFRYGYNYYIMIYCWSDYPWLDENWQIHFIVSFLFISIINNLYKHSLRVWVIMTPLHIPYPHWFCMATLLFFLLTISHTFIVGLDLFS
jgi:hypothetical protein